MDWKIYYGDGSTYSGSLEEAPTRDVQAIVQPCKKTGWALQHTTDYYVWRDDLNEWRGTDINGLWDYLTRNGMKKVLFGRTLLDEEYTAIFRQAKAERDERKVRFSPGERKP